MWTSETKKWTKYRQGCSDATDATLIQCIAEYRHFGDRAAERQCKRRLAGLTHARLVEITIRETRRLIDGAPMGPLLAHPTN